MKITFKNKLIDFLPYMNHLVLIQDEYNQGSIGTLVAACSGNGNILWKLYYAHKEEPVYIYESKKYTISIEKQSDLDE